MTILITNALRETAIVAAVFLLALIISIRRSKDLSFFPLQTTTELKGLAILMVVFSHIGYFLVSDHRFLAPLSNYAGVGVDLFLILSGYGLAVTTLRRPLSVGTFYLKHLQRIYLPVLTTVILFLLLDFFFLHLIYPIKNSIENIFGFFPQADLYQDINSPLWYITLLLAYYFLFPLIFQRRFPVLSALAMAGIGWLAIQYIPQLHVFSGGVIALYKLHFLTFPLGVVMGSLINQPPIFISKTAERLNIALIKYNLTGILRAALIMLSGGVLAYFYYNSHIGENWKIEVIVSLISATAILVLFLFKKFEFKVLTLFGLFSFEIYLLHWPLLFRYNFLYGKIPAGAATLIYLILLLGIGYLYRRVINIFFKPTKNSKLNTL